MRRCVMAVIGLAGCGVSEPHFTEDNLDAWLARECPVDTWTFLRDHASRDSAAEDVTAWASEAFGAYTLDGEVRPASGAPFAATAAVEVTAIGAAGSVWLWLDEAGLPDPLDLVPERYRDEAVGRSLDFTACDRLAAVVPAELSGVVTGGPDPLPLEFAGELIALASTDSAQQRHGVLLDTQVVAAWPQLDERVLESIELPDGSRFVDELSEPTEDASGL